MAVCEQGAARIHYEDYLGGRTSDRGPDPSPAPDGPPTLDPSATVSDGPPNPPVLLVHGGLHEQMDAGRFWVAPGVAGSVAAAGYRVLLPDRRWSGGATTAPVSEHTWALEGADLAAVLRHASAPPALVVAGSNGCSAALRLALDQPELVAGLVLAWPPLREDRWLWEAFERSADFVASAGPGAYLDALRTRGVPGWRERRPGLAFGVALTRDQSARSSFARLGPASAATLLRGSGRSLLAGGTVRGCSDQELRSIPASGLEVAVIAPARDDPTHARAVAERLAELSGAPPPGPGFPETPQPGFAAAREPFQAALLGLLAGMRQRASDRVPPRPAGAGATTTGAVTGSPAAAGAEEPGQDEGPEQ